MTESATGAYVAFDEAVLIEKSRDEWRLLALSQSELIKSQSEVLKVVSQQRDEFAKLAEQAQKLALRASEGMKLCPGTSVSTEST